MTSLVTSLRDVTTIKIYSDLAKVLKNKNQWCNYVTSD